MNQKHCFIYILRCADNSLYTGWSSDPEKRLRVHNSGKGAKYTRSRLPVSLVYSESCPDKPAALRREYQIKQLSHSQKQSLISPSF